jgi:8-oxo-dGTP pyrophosphatase MutT (NUDIX family)
MAGTFQVAAGAVIENVESGNILLIHRAATEYAGNIWEFPIGRLDQFEAFERGLRREVEEETGLTDLSVGNPIGVFEFMRGEHAAENEVRAVVFAARTSQTEVRLSDEHDDFKWLPIDEALALVENPGIRQDLEAFKRNRTTA